ncbi:hypothetical protein MSAN_01856600 [Mycena sanguinolenta]|uniref:Uncharacterized protein n=1 Tax=Mycena sanguinolenta TaxID=230812 RepID=A0A8H6XQT2_9AGAR|nr:hypothetical protein MSAN_01856600 [Mycena sanguinolenta]
MPPSKDLISVPEFSGDAAPFPLIRADTRIRRGIGRTFNEVAVWLGDLWESWANAGFKYIGGPDRCRSRIEQFFMDGTDRQTALDELHSALQYANRQLGKHKQLWGDCHALLTYASAKSTLQTQLVTFKILVTLITRYPGVRRALRDCESLKKASLSDPSFKNLWKPKYDFAASEDWIFHRNFVVFCLSDLHNDSQNDLSDLVEVERPSQLGRVKCEKGTLNKVLIETLLGVSRLGPDFDFPRICAIRYLAGILELPRFWGSTEPDCFSAIFSGLCRTILDLLNDTGRHVGQTSFTSSPSMAAAREAVDILLRATFKALLNIRNPLSYPDLLVEIIDMLLQENMSTCFPRAFNKAQLVSKLLRETAGVADEEPQRAPSPLAAALYTGEEPSQILEPDSISLPLPASRTPESPDNEDLSQASPSTEASDRIGRAPSPPMYASSNTETIRSPDAEREQRGRRSSSIEESERAISLLQYDGLSSGSDIPQEYRAEVDRVFLQYLTRICSNLDATDAKGNPIHQQLMPEEMQELDQSTDFRPFKFRIQAFTAAFLEEARGFLSYSNIELTDRQLAAEGYPEEKIPAKKVRLYLWDQPLILRFNEDGKKLKFKGNHIWSVEVKKLADGVWEFRPFHRKIAGSPPGVAYRGLLWKWQPRIWDPRASWQNTHVQYSSPSLPPWLQWKDDILSGTTPADAGGCEITTHAKFTLDGHEEMLTQTCFLNILPTVSDTTILTRSVPHSPALLVDGDDEARVKIVLESVAARLTQEMQSPPGELSRKQTHMAEMIVNACLYDLEAVPEDGIAPDRNHDLAIAGQNVVAQAAEYIVRKAAPARAAVVPPNTSAMQTVNTEELVNTTKEAIAEAVAVTTATQTSASGTSDVDELSILLIACRILDAALRPTANSTTTTAASATMG